MNGNRIEIQIDLEKNIYGSHMEVEESLFNFKNISLDGNETVWKSYRNGRKPF